jgi:apolipoprotein N-acyltransferase
MTTAIIEWAAPRQIGVAKRTGSPGLLPAALAYGLLLGISAPKSFSWYTHPAAWFMLLPVWLVVNRRTRFLPFVLLILAGNALALTVGTFGIVEASGAAAPIYLLYAGIQFTLPHVVFFVFGRVIGFRKAILLAPAIWPLTDWAIRQYDGSILYANFAVMQSNGIWWNQFADLFGEWGLISFVVAFNSAFYFAIATKHDGWRNPRAALTRAAIASFCLLAPAVGYSAFRLHAEDVRLRNARSLEVLLVQTNIDTLKHPVIKENPMDTAARMTEKALFEKKPDLIVWSEGIVMGSARRDAETRKKLAQAVADYGTPLITGTMDSLLPVRQRRAKAGSTPTQAAILITPGPPGSQGNQTSFGPVHNKRRLVPFFEGVPPGMNFQAARDLRDRLSSLKLVPGRDSNLLSWVADQGWRETAAAPLCWEALRADDLAAFARQGAEFFTVLSNDDIFGVSSTIYAPAAITRLRAIENRRSISLVGDTGITGFYDAAGRITRQAGLGVAVALRGSVTPNTSLTLYSRFPGLFPALCAAVLLTFPFLLWRKAI